MRGVRAFVATLCLVGWILLCVALLIHLLDRVSAKGVITPEALQWTVWPIVVLAISLPLSVALLQQGDNLLQHLLKIQSTIENLPSKLDEATQNIERFHGVALSLKNTSDLIEIAVERAEEAADKAKQAVSAANESLGEANELSRGAADASAPEEVKMFAERLDTHYQRVKEAYAQAVNLHQMLGGEEIVGSRGYILSENVKKLETQKAISQAQSDYMKKVLSLEATSRRSSRQFLTDGDLKELDELYLKSAL